MILEHFLRISGKIFTRFYVMFVDKQIIKAVSGGHGLSISKTGLSKSISVNVGVPLISIMELCVYFSANYEFL